MKLRTWTIVIAVVSFLGGAIGGGIAGGYVAIYFVSGFFGDGWMLGKGVNTQTQIAILENIRNGRTGKAIEFLEITLDENIMSLSFSDKHTPKTNEVVSKAVQKAKDYRAKYPRHSQFPEMDQAVAKVLEQNAK